MEFVMRDTKPLAWMKDAECVDEPLEYFITPGDGDLVHEPAYPRKEAKEICNRCPVRTECLKWAMADPELIGVWGGMTEYQRGLARRPRERVRCIDCGSADYVVTSDDEKHQTCRGCGISWDMI